MAKTEVRGGQVKDATISRDDLDVATTGQAVARKIIAGTNISISSTGVDAGTGDITINNTGAGSGDVVGPSSSIDSQLAEFDGTTGKAIKAGPKLTIATTAPGSPTAGDLWIDTDQAADTYTDAGLSMSDVSTNDSSSSMHGFLKKLTNLATDCMNGAGNWIPRARREIITLTPSASQNNYSTGAVQYADVSSTIRINPSNTIKVTGILATSFEDGKIIRISNNGVPTAAASRLLILERESASSTAANRFTWQQGYCPVFLMPGDWAEFEYDTTASRWKYTSGNRPFDNILGNFDVGTDTGVGAATTSSGTGATSLISAATDQTSYGIISSDTGTTAAGRSYLVLASATALDLTHGCNLCVTRIRPFTALSTSSERYQLRVGLHDGAAATDVVDGVYWEYDDVVSGDWRTCTSNNSTVTKNTVTGVTVSLTVWHTLGVFVNADATQADFFYQDNTTPDAVVLVATSHTTNLPAAGRWLSPESGINKTVGTTSRVAATDWQGHRAQFSGR